MFFVKTVNCGAKCFATNATSFPFASLASTLFARPAAKSTLASAATKAFASNADQFANVHSAPNVARASLATSAAKTVVKLANHFLHAKAVVT